MRALADGGDGRRRRHARPRAVAIELGRGHGHHRWLRSERLDEFLDVDLLRHDADLGAEVGELLQIAELRRREVLRPSCSRASGRISTRLSGVMVFLARYLRASSGFVLMKSTALAQAAAKRLRDIGPLLDEIRGQARSRRHRRWPFRRRGCISRSRRLRASWRCPSFHHRRAGLERIAAVECAGLHRVDVLAHVELVDRVVAILEADLGEHAPWRC